MGADQYSRPNALLREMLVAARKTAGLSQEKLAIQLAKPQSFVAKVETGERRLDVIEFVRIAHVLKLDPVPFIEALMRATE